MGSLNGCCISRFVGLATGSVLQSEERMRCRLATIAVAFLVTPTAAAAPEPPDDYRPLPVQGGVTTVSRIEPKLSAVATNLAGRVVEVRCWSVADWQRLDQEWRDYRGTGISGFNGYVHRTALERMQLSPRTCAALASFIYANARPTDRTPVQRNRLASALLAFAHEAQHNRGIDEEAVAECRGVQLVRPVARLLGASRAYAAFIATAAWKRSYGPHASYRSEGCHNGGPGDINPATSIWP